MKTKIFIDGREGTTGLRINERFKNRDDIELLTISWIISIYSLFVSKYMFIIVSLPNLIISFFVF